MASVHKRYDGWEVRWKEPVVTVNADGREIKTWKSRRRPTPTKAAAETLAREIETSLSLGQNWEAQNRRAVATLRTVALAYVKAAIESGAPVGSQQQRSTALGAFLRWLGAQKEGDPGAGRPVTELSLTLLQDYAASLPRAGRQAVTSYRKVGAVERMWSWAAERPERFPGVPAPRRFTGSVHESDKLRPPPAVVATATPTWEQVDRMIAALPRTWHRAAATVQRFTGLRISQVLGLRWADVDLARGILRVQPGRVGAKQGRGRVVPLAPQLHDVLQRWHELAPPAVGADLLFLRPPEAPGGPPRPGPFPSNDVAKIWRGAWERAGVPRDRWDKPGDDSRGNAKPTHAIRGCIRAGLLRAGVEEALTLYLIGHTQGVTAAAYVPEDTPEESPYWPRLVEAVRLIPGMGFDPLE